MGSKRPGCMLTFSPLHGFTWPESVGIIQKGREMPIGKSDVGGRIYVFSNNLGQQVNTECVIDAHGEQTIGNRTFEVPEGRSISFYVDHGHPQIFNNGSMTFPNNSDDNFAYTNALEAIATGVAEPRHTIDGGGRVTVPDYSLSKIQRTKAGCMGGAWSNWIGERNDMTYEHVERFIGHFPATRDIVTIRNRQLKLEILLSEVVRLLTHGHYNYTAIHCSFCRSPFIARSKEGQRVLGATYAT